MTTNATATIAALAGLVDAAALALGVDLAEDIAAADAYATAGVAENTRRAYSADWSSFVAYCAERGVAPLPAPAEVVRAYLAHLADDGLSVATIRRRATSISAVHQVAGFPSPTTSPEVRATLRGIARGLGTRQRAVAPFTAEHLRQVVASTPATMIGRRDRALLALAFAGALRRSEVVALLAEDVRFVAAGMVVAIRRSKTDQTGAGREVAIPFGRRGACPVALVRDWIDAASISSGPLFRRVTRHGEVGTGAMDGGSVARIVKKHADALGLDAEQFSGHSLRAGFVTSCAAAGVDDRRVMDQTGHQSLSSFRRYVRHADKFTQNAAAEIL